MVRGERVHDDEGVWLSRVKSAIERYHNGSEVLKNMHKILLHFLSWAKFCRAVHEILGDLEDESAPARAMSIYKGVKAVDAEVDDLSRPILKQLVEDGTVKEETDSTTPVGARYQFGTLEASEFVLYHAQLRLYFNRMTMVLESLFHGPEGVSAQVKDDFAYWCREIWLCIPYQLELSLMAAVTTADPVHASYEGAEGEIKEYLLDYIIKISKYRGRLPDDREVVSKYMMDTAKALSGRALCDERTDFPYWAERFRMLEGKE